MMRITTVALGAALAAMAGSAAFAQSTLSPTETQTWQNCQTMSHDAMMANTDCSSIVNAHPDILQGRSATGSSATPSGPLNGNAGSGSGLGAGGAAGGGSGAGGGGAGR